MGLIGFVEFVGFVGFIEFVGWQQGYGVRINGLRGNKPRIVGGEWEDRVQGP